MAPSFPLMDPSTLSPHALHDEFEHLNIYFLKENPHVTIVLLNRPEKRNALNCKLWKEIGLAFAQLGSRGDGCRAIVLGGAGPHSFCAGIDLMDPTFASMLTNKSRASTHPKISKSSSWEGTYKDTKACPPIMPVPSTMDSARQGLTQTLPLIQEMQACLTAIEACPVPVIAAIHGACIGAGVDLACCADVRLASLDAIFSVREVQLGLAADVGTLQRFPKLCGSISRVKEVCLTGQNFQAQEAYRIGLLSQVCQDHKQLWDDAIHVASQIAAQSPIAVAGTKLSLNYSRDHSVQDGLDHVARHNALALMTGDVGRIRYTSNGDNPTIYPSMPPYAKL